MNVLQNRAEKAWKEDPGASNNGGRLTAAEWVKTMMRSIVRPVKISLSTLSSPSCASFSLARLKVAEEGAQHEAKVVLKLAGDLTSRHSLACLRVTTILFAFLLSIFSAIVVF